MDSESFLELMNFPRAWQEWGMFPPELADSVVEKYKKGDEAGSEHDRNGAFHWWLRQSPGVSVLVKLVKLSALDPDPLMARDVRRYIRSSVNADDHVRRMIDEIDRDGG